MLTIPLKIHIYFKRHITLWWVMDRMCTDTIVQRIKIVGCGGAGINTVNRLYHMGVDGAEFIAIDTDRGHLEAIDADKKVRMIKPPIRGFISYSWPEFGKQAAELSKSTIQDVFMDADLVFMIVGMGGSAGTGAAPIIARIAREQGAVVIGVVCTPLMLERVRLVKAKEGIDLLEAEVDMLIVLDNHKLYEHYPEMPITGTFGAMDRIIAGMVRDIVETIVDPEKADIAGLKDIASNTDIVFIKSCKTGRGETYSKEVRKAMSRVEPAIRADYADQMANKS
jgi:cell division protein FtsZ